MTSPTPQKTGGVHVTKKTTSSTLQRVRGFAVSRRKARKADERRQAWIGGGADRCVAAAGCVRRDPERMGGKLSCEPDE